MSCFFSLLKWLAGLIILLAAAIYAFLEFHPTFGGKPDAESLLRIQSSPNFNGEIFVNLEETAIRTSEEELSWGNWILAKFNPPKGKRPAQPLPTIPLNINQFKNGSVAWFGHSSVLLKTGDKFLMTDPVFYDASPVPFTVEPFPMTHKPSIDELPYLDAVLISHDHYDHLDYRAIQQLESKTQQFIVPLGVKAHLQHWGVPNEKIIELDWDEQAKVGEVNIILVPARHFSGRSFSTQNSTLWGGYVIKSPDLSLYFSADTGYGTHFAKRIAQYAPFDFVMVENGAYNEKWSLIHELPEQAIQAVNDLHATKAMPIHWGKFDLAEHHWKESIERFMTSAELHQVQTATPKIGEVFNIFETLPNERWWEKLE